MKATYNNIGQGNGTSESKMWVLYGLQKHMTQSALAALGRQQRTGAVVNLHCTLSSLHVFVET